MATVPRPHAPPGPFIAPIGGDLNQRLSQVAQAINRKADATTTPSFAAINLTATNGSTWQLTVSAAGALVITQVGT
jgi:hypothetical protein